MTSPLTPTTRAKLRKLEELCPLLRAHKPKDWKDFRDDSTEWRGGIFVNTADPQQMKALFGAKETCLKAQKQLAAIGIASELEQTRATLMPLWKLTFNVGDMHLFQAEWDCFR